MPLILVGLFVALVGSGISHKKEEHKSLSPSQEARLILRDSLQARREGRMIQDMGSYRGRRTASYGVKRSQWSTKYSPISYGLGE